MPLHLIVDLIGQTQAAVVHGQQETFNLQLLVELTLNNFDGAQQLTDTFQGEVFALHWDDHRIGCRECIYRDEPQGRATVDKDEIVFLFNRVLEVFEHPFTIF